MTSIGPVMVIRVLWASITTLQLWFGSILFAGSWSVTSSGSKVVALLWCATWRALFRQSYICHGCTPYNYATVFTVAPLLSEARTSTSRSSSDQVRRFASAGCDLLSRATAVSIPQASRNFALLRYSVLAVRLPT